MPSAWKDGFESSFQRAFVLAKPLTGRDKSCKILGDFTGTNTGCNDIYLYKSTCTHACRKPQAIIQTRSVVLSLTIYPKLTVLIMISF